MRRACNLWSYCEWWSESKITLSFTLSDRFNFHAQLTIIVEVNVVWQRLVVRREVGSIVFEELPFHPIFILLFLPPNRYQNYEKMMVYLRVKLLLPCFPMYLVFDYVCVCLWVVGGGPDQCEIKRAAFSNHLQRFCSSSSFFLIFNCFASSISSFVLLGFLETGCSPSSFFTICTKEKHSRCEFKHSCHEPHFQQTS